MIKKLYNKSIEWAAHKRSKSILGFISFIESFIFPFPPDLLIIPMTIAKMNDWFKIALIATIGSVLGACFGYLIGYLFFNEIGIPIFELYGVDIMNKSNEVIYTSASEFYQLLKKIRTFKEKMFSFF